MQIEIPELLLKRLQKLATPFVDTPVSVIERCVDVYERNSDKADAADYNPSVPDIRQSMRRLDPRRPPSLLHTRVRGQFGAIAFSSWNDLLRIAHVEAFKRTRSFEELRNVTRAQIKKGPYSNEGYHHVPEIDVSIQGVDADRAWEYTLRLAIYLKVPLKAEIEWRNNDRAAYPGESALISWSP